MKRNALSALIALALVGGSAVAQAQDFGNWYIAPRIGANFSDSSRETDTSVWGGFGVGVWVNPHLAVDFEYTINNAKFEHVDVDPQTFHSTPSPDKCASAATGVSFDDPIM